MKRKIIERYERTAENEVIIAISATKIEDLYDDFDKKSTFLKKDLNHDLVEYIIESVKEIEQEKFIIEFNLEVMASDASISRVKNSVNSFFIYMQELEARKMSDMIRTSLILLLIGVVLATLSVIINKNLAEDTSVVTAVVAEGLTVAAWVSLWEALATFLIKWMPYKKTISLFKRIATSTIRVEFSTQKK
ncbi:MAG: hypothetical protein GW906_09350 [Epsilonproteobacteria bacterium]|nr:hypothetical protein [Campylobacterota bacterium]OIO13416.1 MAG: hypothetical protein AUJ81_11365 [Helicobacteraceae bacterium CG1_02_36_14]PIP09871.1 MAG: hypothetical protein COX50_09210 [Sulfurimonas sp. CG23_combo_of_CG06-09_8_20_14_all_36_33]PIS24087.1 MAG: hypothetical protein COT46_11150 [Sulfurimonas sp. CG08_land_8_20_14_0_20_36_33]PIU35571.1 MAG: hypothetical protein COT05_03290 [Sulfurimonas sp. CG07_land_8_20_14_0_80_36_56]PIV05492.1 MAG: hypothetical protein COS56_01600 [Sulfur